MKIITDCAADMPRQELWQFGVAEVPLYIQVPDGEVDSTAISADAFYDRLEAMRPALPSTAMPSTAVFAALYNQVALEDTELLSLHISSGLSGTVNTARAAAEQVKPQVNVHCWDSLTLSGGQRFQVMAAAEAARAGWTLETIQDRLRAIHGRTQVIYTLDTLEYLARGGRIGRVQALAGSLLKLKPIIRVAADGRYTAVGSSRTIDKAIVHIAEYLLSEYADTPVWVTTLHGRFADPARVLETALKQKLSVVRSETLRISPVLGVHTGPGVVGAAVVPAALVSDLGLA